MTMTTTPDFSSFKLEFSPEDLGENKGTGFKSIAPGVQNVKIKSAEWKGAPEKDPTFNKLRVTYVDNTGAEISEYLLVPTKSPKYGPSGTTVPFQKLIETVRALGIEISAGNAGEVLPKIFRDVNNLVGMHLTIKVGYKGSYAHYVSKNNFNLVDAKTMETIESGLSTRDECEALAAERGIAYSKWPEVFSRMDSVTKNNLTKFSAPAKKIAFG